MTKYEVERRWKLRHSDMADLLDRLEHGSFQDRRVKFINDIYFDKDSRIRLMNRGWYLRARLVFPEGDLRNPEKVVVGWKGPRYDNKSLTRPENEREIGEEDLLAWTVKQWNKGRTEILGFWKRRTTMSYEVGDGYTINVEADDIVGYDVLGETIVSPYDKRETSDIPGDLAEKGHFPCFFALEVKSREETSIDERTSVLDRVAEEAGLDRFQPDTQWYWRYLLEDAIAEGKVELRGKKEDQLVLTRSMF